LISAQKNIDGRPLFEVTLDHAIIIHPLANNTERLQIPMPYATLASWLVPFKLLLVLLLLKQGTASFLLVDGSGLYFPSCSVCVRCVGIALYGARAVRATYPISTSLLLLLVLLH
jgi:hypothetical protein